MAGSAPLTRCFAQIADCLCGYAHGRLDYLPEPRAYDEGGYEVTYPYYMGISRHFQARVWQAIEAALGAQAPV